MNNGCKNENNRILFLAKFFIMGKPSNIFLFFIMGEKLRDFYTNPCNVFYE